MIRPLLVSLALLWAVAANCSQPRSTNSRPSGTPAASPSPAQITEISLAVKYAWFTNPPDYKVTLLPDGTVTHTMLRTKEQRHGKLSTAYFYDLARLIESQGFFGMGERPQFPVTDADVYEIEAVRDNTRKTVKYMGVAQPIELFGIAMAIEGAVSHAAWDRTKPPPPLVH